MRFGASVRTNDVSFALWAPAATRVALSLTTRKGRQELPMTAEADGWFTAVSPVARPGDRYAFVLDGKTRVPDPASRRQPEDVHGDSEIVDPAAFRWSDADWPGRPWEETVIYELHVGTFTPQGTYTAVAEKLDHLTALGITAIELMPLAEAPGAHNWGYDGVCLFAPEARYGTPDDLKALIAAAHARGLMVFLDVVYNHFGPEGNYLWASAPDFFTERHHTPWGVGIDFSGRMVRDFFIHNALYWLEEYHFDGLRLDAVQAIRDESDPHILVEIAAAITRHFGDRPIHLILENDDNRAALLARDPNGRPRLYEAQWNDDAHNALHVALTGEVAGQCMDFADDPVGRLARALGEGFAYQGERSRYREGRARGEASRGLPPTAFVNFLQNHDQVGNRLRGERIIALAPPAAVRAGIAIVLLSPTIPLLFMGEEWGSRQPFHFFCDFAPELARRVREARRTEIAVMFQADPAARASIVDPTAPEAFRDSVLQWIDAKLEPHAAWLGLYQRLLRIRHAVLVPRLAGAQSGSHAVLGSRRRALTADWLLGDGSRLHLIANLDDAEAHLDVSVAGDLLYATDPEARQVLPPWFVAWTLDEVTS
jgi:maltooligosyltrehalose trehalohydrolase